MPVILIKNHTWRQTSERLIVKIPLAGHPADVDFFLVDNYLKASFPPFLLELFLWGNVVEEESECTVTEDVALLSLKKEEASDWPRLELDNLDKNAKRKYREQALERSRSIAEERTKAKSEKRQLLQKEAVKAQINLDTATLNKMDAMRDSHRKEAMRELEDWRTCSELPILRDAEGILQTNRKAYKPPLKWFKDQDGTVKSRELTTDEILKSKAAGIRLTEVEEIKESDKEKEKEKDEIQDKNKNQDCTSKNNVELSPGVSGDEHSSSSTDSESDNEDNSYSGCGGKMQRGFCKKKHKEVSGRALYGEGISKGKPMGRPGIFDSPGKSVPLPRKSGVINVTFSERAFPTPARESSRLEEEEWLQKQAEARRKTGFVAEDLRPEERDPQWLKDKGDEFFKIGNYLGAISAYTHGIKISDKMASLYVNRSAAQYALGNYVRCVEDSSKALELMEPKCEGNRESRARCHARRGAALCKLSAPQHGIPELEAALKLLPGNESIKRDLLAARQYFNVKD